jgi:hypothetical protein
MGKITHIPNGPLLRHVARQTLGSCTAPLRVIIQGLSSDQHGQGRRIIAALQGRWDQKKGATRAQTHGEPDSRLIVTFTS